MLMIMKSFFNWCFRFGFYDHYGSNPTGEVDLAYTTDWDFITILTMEIMRMIL